MSALAFPLFVLAVTTASVLAVRPTTTPMPVGPCGGFIPGVCEAGSVCGWDWMAVSFSCQPCPVNTFAVTSGFRKECTVCPAGTWTEGSTGASQCVPMPALLETPLVAPSSAAGDIPIPTIKSCSGFIPGVCEAGFSCAWDPALISFSCQACPANTFANDTSFRMNCTSCPAGTWTEGDVASTECVPLPAPAPAALALKAAAGVEGDIPIPSLKSCSGFIPGVCDPGFACAWDPALISFSCQACPANTFANDTAFRKNCSACPAGTWTEGDVASIECVPLPAPAPSSAVMAGKSGVLSIKFTTGETVVEEDIPIPALKSCSGFIPGVCEAGFACAWEPALISFSCQACPADTFANDTAFRKNCTACPAGTWTQGEVGSTECSPVLPAAPTAAVALSAGVVSGDLPFAKGPCGGFVPGTCDAGLLCAWDLTKIAFDCEPCPVNTFAAVSGWRFDCLACPAGAWTEGKEGATECVAEPVALSGLVASD